MRAHWWLTVRIFTMLLFSTALTLGTETGAQADTKTVDGRTYSLSWNDEFNGTKVDSSKWFVVSEDNFWGAIGNRFDPTKAKPYVKNGVLNLPIRRVNGVWYQSGIRGHNEKTWATKKYFLPNTYLEARVKMPKGVLPASGGNKTGIWSAGWLMPARGIVDDYYYQSGGNRNYWPHGGEVDWWETQWQGDWGRHMIWTTLIQANNSNPTRMTKVARYLGSNEVRGVPDWQTKWHVMSAHWFRDAGTIKWIFRVDGIQIANYQGGNFTGDPENWDRWADNKLLAKFQRAFWGGQHSANGQPGSPFEKPFYLIFNSSVKGGGPIDQNDVKPNPANDGQALQIDWVRAYTPPR